MIQPAEQVEQGRFSAAARPHDRKRLAFLDGERNAMQRDDTAAVEFAPDLVEFDESHARSIRLFELKTVSHTRDQRRNRAAIRRKLGLSLVAGADCDGCAVDQHVSHDLGGGLPGPFACIRQSSSPRCPSLNFTCETTTTSPLSRVRAPPSSNGSAWRRRGVRRDCPPPDRTGPR